MTILQETTPKEKAEKLTNDILEVIGAGASPEYKEYLYMEVSKQCAIICCNEILSITENRTDSAQAHRFWELVKKEVEQL